VVTIRTTCFVKISLPHSKHAESSRTLSIYCEYRMNIQGQSVDKT